MWFCHHHWHLGILEVLLAQQLPSQMPLSTYANYAMGPMHVGFSFRVELPTILFLYVWCLFWCMLLLSGAKLDAVFINGAKPLGFAPLQPFWIYPRKAYVQPGDGYWPRPGMHRVAAPASALSRGSLLLLNQLSSSQSSYMAGIHLWGLGRESPDPSTFLAWWGGVFFSRFVSTWWHGWLWICGGH